LVKFIIEDDGKNYNLDFSIVKTNNENLNFNSYLDLKDTQEKIFECKQNIKQSERILKLKLEIEKQKRITPYMRNELFFLGKYVKRDNDKLYLEAIDSDNIEKYKKIVDILIETNSFTNDKLQELEGILKAIKSDIMDIEDILKQDNLTYISHLNDNTNVLLLKTNMPVELQDKLTKKVYLTAPNSQVFLFLTAEEKESIFGDFIETEHFIGSYSEILKNTKAYYLDGFFTYDFASTELILESFQKASDEDLKEKRKTGDYGKKYDELRNELKDFLDGKEISENEDGNMVIFKSKINGEILVAEDLSHGELKKLGIYIWLKHIVEEDSIILMDEIDIALHPKWQYELVNDLELWSKNSQFLLATHSPQIISSTYYKNIIMLDNGKSIPLSKPPVDRGIKNISNQIMGATAFPINLLKLQNDYRKLVEDGQVNSDEAKKLKIEILEYESESSSFFQDINFDLELM